MSVLVSRKVGVLPFVNIYTITCIIVMSLIGFHLNLNAAEDKTGLSNLYLLMLVQIAPFVLCFARGHYDYISFILINHFVTYSVAKLNSVRDLIKTGPLPFYSIMAINELIICSILMIAGFYLSRMFFFRKFVHKSSFQMLSLSRWQLILLTGYVVCMPLYFKYLPPNLVAFHFTFLAADMALLWTTDSPGNEKLAQYLRMGVFVSCFWYFLYSGALMMFGFLAGYIFISSCLKRDYKKLILPCILAFLASSIQPVKGLYRAALAENLDMTMSEKGELLLDLLYIQYTDDAVLKAKLREAAEAANEEVAEDDGADDVEKDNTETLMSGFARVGDESLERVLDWTPRKVPFWGGESYSALPFIFIPRFLWPDKPSRHIWNNFGRTYGYISEDDIFTSVAVNYFAEGYMNFGFFGMYGVALFIGFLSALVERMSYALLGGWFYFSFLLFLAPMVTFAVDLTSIVNSLAIITCVVLLARNQLLRMALRDDYT